ncbi:MAG: sensor hybrid histidine kinase, partial [Polaromonas sp.]|nr:sensor hybrid histidine kinase [Polaromonas sp.]
DLRDSNQALDHRTTELLHAEDALRQSQKLEALGQLTGGVAHDFNNLLAVISASAELLRSPRLARDQRGPYLDRIIETVARGARLTGQLLAFARQQPLSPKVFDVDLQVKNVIDLIRPLMGGKVEIFHQPCGANACLAMADINQFETALVNLAINARDAMDANGRLIVKVQAVNSMPAGLTRAMRSEEFITISVSDTGCGIAPDQLQAIFEPFYTTKEVGKGTGLGLSQVFGFARQSGGAIDVVSELGAGSVFTLYLARAHHRPFPLATPAALDARAQGAVLERGVLVVEDNEILGEMACEILNALGYRAVWAASAAAALNLLAAHGSGFDVVFSDVVMPGMNGIELGNEVRLRYPGLPVVLTSGSSALKAHEGQCGFEMVLKPYTSETLVRAFRKAMAEPV